MTAKLQMVTLWTDLEQAGGSCDGALWPFNSLQTNLRIDGDDRATGVLLRSATGVSSLSKGKVLRYERADGSIENWIAVQTNEEVFLDRMAVTAVPARTWLAERVVVSQSGVFSFTLTGALSTVLTSLLATDAWPSWAIAGTISRDPVISVTLTNTNGLAAILALVAAANAHDDLVLRNETMRFVFRRVSATQYAIDLLTTAASGVPVLAQGRNLVSFAVRSDRTPQATQIYPLNATGVTIAEAMFAVRTAGGGLLDMRDWAYRPDFLGVAFDGQWVGWYAVAPDGTTSLITNSYAATQQIQVASTAAWGAGNNNVVQISPTVAGSPTLRVADLTAPALRAIPLAGTWSKKINWLPNSRFDQWTSSSIVADWAAAGGWVSSQATGGSNVETGTYSIQYTSTAAPTDTLTVSEIGMPSTIVSPGGGTQTWRVGMRARRSVSTGETLSIQVSKDSGGSWTTVVNGITSTSFATIEGTFTTNAATLPNRPRIRIIGASNTAGSTFIIDRLWLFRDGVEDDDNTYVGNGPSVGFYQAQRALLQRRNGDVTYDVGVIDRTRDDPTGFPDDDLAVAQSARLIVPSATVDTSLQVVALDVDELHAPSTGVQLGALRNRLTDSL